MAAMQMDPELARRLFFEGATVVILNMPKGTEFGIDYNSWEVGPKFRGVKMIPPGIHFLHYSSVDKANPREVGPRMGFFLNLQQRGLKVLRWDAAREEVDLSPAPEAEVEAEKFIKANPTSPVSFYLLQKCFLQSLTPDYAKAYTLCELLHKKQSQNQHVARLLTQLETLKTYATTGPLPLFQAISTDGDTVTESTMRSDVNVIMVWTTWNYDSQSPMHSLSRLKKKYPHRFSVLSICLDASPSEGKGVLERDSVSWPNVCDSLMFQSPLLAQLGIATIPANIVTDKQGNIVARNLSSNDLQNKVKQMLGEN